MKAKKLFVISLAVICACAVLLSLFFIFSIKDVKTNYTVTASSSVEEVEKTLNAYEKKNLLFLDIEEVRKDLEKHPYFEVVSIEKDFPNVLKVTLKERIEVFTLADNGNLYVLDKTGLVLNCVSGQTSIDAYLNKGLMDISLKGLEIEGISVGEVVKTNDQDLFLAMLDMAGIAGYGDTFKSAELDKMGEDDNGEPIVSTYYKYVNFQTNTGVVIRVVFRIDNGQETGTAKIQKALERYYRGSDYEKARYRILAYYNEDINDNVALWEGFDTEV